MKKTYRRTAGVLAKASVGLLGALATIPVSGAPAEAADLHNGQLAFVRQCALCHTVGKGEPNRYGPNLFGILDRKAGSVPGFKYSAAFTSTAAWNWSADVLAAWISAPRTMVPGSPMDVFQGVADRDKDDIVAYLAAQK
jgi:cytochrome c